MVRLNRCVALALLLSSAAALQVAPAPTQKDVDVERAKLQKMSTMLGGLLKNDALSKSKVAPALKMFSHNLDSALNETKSMSKVDAIKKLEAVRASVSGLVGELTKTQEGLMKENFEQQESLLMGVLMTHQKDSREDQMAILKNPEFQGLDVSKALMKSNDTKTPLYILAAQYLDANKNASGVIAKVADHASRIQATADSLDKRVASLEKERDAKELRHKSKMDEMTKLASKGGKEAKIGKAAMKREERNFKKWAASQNHDIQSMKEASAAVRSGDTKALNHAMKSLQASLDALKNKNSGIVVFLQQANSALEQDCPYCAAQCVEKCHNGGNPYTTCLTQCADAGKQ